MTKLKHEALRANFEQIIKASKRYADSTPLDIMTINGAFHHYMDPDTDTMWIGFVMGMNCAALLDVERQKLLALLNAVSHAPPPPSIGFL